MSVEGERGPADIELPEHGEPRLTPRERLAIPRQAMPEQPSGERVTNFSEVALGLEARAVRIEALRCIQCKDRPCVDGCPVGIDIPAFVKRVAGGDFAGGLAILKADNALPAVCGRVCPQEEQCEARCTLGKKVEPVAIGRIERFLADWERETKPPKEVVNLLDGEANPVSPSVGRAERGRSRGPLDKPLDSGPAALRSGQTVLELGPLSTASNAVTAAASTGKKVAIVGSGPAGLTAAADLVRLGHAVTIFEALHRPGGVLVYGIPEFRLPKRIVEHQVKQLEDAGVRFESSVVVGQTLTLDELRQSHHAVFIATGAGLPSFMNVPGESLCGVYSANEYLTRVNLMRAYSPDADTPIARARAVAVVGGGNVAMDAARTAKRLGAEHVYLLYRRGRAEMPARKEEVHHAEEEGVELLFLHTPVRYEGDARGWVRQAVLQKLALGALDETGRRSPVPTNEHVELAVDAVIVAIGNGPNPLVPRTSPGLKTKRNGTLLIEKATGRTSLRAVWAGGDIVLGAATVILAMGAGRTAARSIDAFLATGVWDEPRLDS